MFFIDIDNFKFINDTMGHAFGDELIACVGERLASLESGDGRLIYRLGGDEFVILQNGCSQTEEIEEYAFRVISCFREPLLVGNSLIHTTVSIGIARFPEHGRTPEELLKYSDIAMYQAKREGKNKYVMYSQDMQEAFNKRMLLENHLRSALDNQEMELFYQPQFELKTGKICGLEALLRWRSPQLGFVSPKEFIPVAEDSHMIIPIGEWVLRNACYYIKKLHNNGYTDLTMSVNISILQLLQKDFSENVRKILEFIKLAPQYLELEITESSLAESYETVHEELEHLRAIGVKVALDDFGKGYSSLGELKQLPVTKIKIDKTFIDSIHVDKISSSITSMIISIGRKMGLTVLAEGVEKQEQVDFLLRNRCHTIQGYLFSKPLPENEISQLFPAKTAIRNNSGEFVWKKEYNIDIDEIDKQHQKIFAIGNKISQLVFSHDCNNCYDKIVSILQELKTYTQEHFQIEEELMKKYNYIFYESHKNEHAYFIQKLLKFDRMIAAAAMPKETIIELLDDVFVWITNHIIKVDRHLVNLLNTRP